jgi:hypothetical protein
MTAETLKCIALKSDQCYLNKKISLLGKNCKAIFFLHFTKVGSIVNCTCDLASQWPLPDPIPPITNFMELSPS